jgi:hypothetical protein
MANGRNGRNKPDSGRDAGGFSAIPWSVLDCPAYALLSHVARSLLLELARQYVRDNNGRLLASRAHLAKRGWKSADVIHRAKHELIEAGFIAEMVKGHRPNKASWYAITWQTLNRLQGFDPGAAAAFERGAYRKAPAIKNASLSPAGGTEGTLIAPSPGTEKRLPVPSAGTMKAVLAPAPVPSSGHPLEKPSAVVNARDGMAQAAQQNLDEVERVRDCDQDPALFDPVTGEYFKRPPKPARRIKAAAGEWVASALSELAANNAGNTAKQANLSNGRKPSIGAA